MAMVVSARRMFWWNMALIGVIGLLFWGVAVANDVRGHHYVYGLAHIVRLSDEGNLPTVYSFSSLLFVSFVALTLARSAEMEARERRGWMFFAVVFFWLGCDDMLVLHELLNPLGDAIGAPPFMHYFGAFPYALFAAAVGLYMFPFWLRQSRPVKLGMAIGGVVYVACGVGMEIPENLLIVGGVARTSLPMAICYTIEELGEMTAVAIFLRAFLTRIEELPSGAMVGFVVPGAARAAAPPPAQS